MTGVGPFPPREQQFLEHARSMAKGSRRPAFPPVSLNEWEIQKQELRKRLLEAWGGFPETASGLTVKLVGTVQRDGYRVEKLLIETFPDVWLTANAYVPEREGKLPAVLGVHGHWKGAKQDPVVQSRCIGLAKLGFFVLMVDAIGAGERAIGKGLGEYHGAMTGGSLLPTGRTLAGLQVAENMRCVDYLRTRPEVDPERIGVTGASGGGNQSMYEGAFDERIKAAVPVCSVGSYRVYVGVACCMCEVVPGALQFTEESGVLALTAPRALMVINATKDAVQFSVAQAEGSLKEAHEVYKLYGVEGKLRHTIFESGHDYSRPMREAMYGWMTLHLKGEGDGSPIQEPEFTTEDPETLRCFPGESRPETYVTLPQLCEREGRLALENVRRQPATSIEESRRKLVELLLPTLPEQAALQQRLEKSPREGYLRMWFVSEPGLEVFADVRRGKGQQPWVILMSLKGASAVNDPVLTKLEQSGCNLAILNGRGTGEFSPSGNQIHTAPDHNTAEWDLWVGRPTLGGWGWDVMRLVQALGMFGAVNGVHLVGLETGALPIAAGAAITISMSGKSAAELKSVNLRGGMGSYVTGIPFQQEYLGVMVPGILAKFGDVAEILGTLSPTPLSIGGAKNATGDPIPRSELESVLAVARNRYAESQQAEALTISETQSAEDLLRRLGFSS